MRQFDSANSAIVDLSTIALLFYGANISTSLPRWRGWVFWVMAGGGPSVIPLIQQEAVGAQWMTADEFAAALAMGSALPGSIATKMSAYIGYTVLMERINNTMVALLGAVSGVLGMVVPSFIMMLILAVGFLQFKDYPQVKGALQAVNPVIVGLLAYTAWTVVPQPLRMDAVWIAALSFLLLVTWDVHPVLLILAATIFGAFVYAR